MSFSAGNDWHQEFGIASGGPRAFFTNKDELSVAGSPPQSHILRRAFDLLKLDGIFCADGSPLVYFKQIKRVDTVEIARLHRIFWNHGGAPILVLIAPDEVQIYSGLTRPVSPDAPSSKIPSLVDTIQRLSSAMREFLPAVESGDFFRRHARSFDPNYRVDRDLLDNLQAARQKLITLLDDERYAETVDALLCRLVFACYLFDRKVIQQSYLDDIGLRHVQHLRDILAIRPRGTAKKYLYDLFSALGDDFNGDLFSDNLPAEARHVGVSYIDVLDDFFRGTKIDSGQRTFWPYDFAAIPIETISAIYERFLKSSSKKQGAFYTPRFLAELVLDLALADVPVLLGRRYLDPACGSGIFLVGLFNRMAEEWRRNNPDAGNDRRARELRAIMCSNLYGVDINPTACKITAFSLYLAYLDQLSPRDIQELQEKGHKLPRLVHYPKITPGDDIEGNIWCSDFFSDSERPPITADLVVGNPPWGSTALDGTPAAGWCNDPEHLYPIPDKQISAAFLWKSGHHASLNGRAVLVLPHGTLFNHSKTALEFQRALFRQRTIDHVLNLADYQFFLFEEARHPALVLSYRIAPAPRNHSITYWAPKTDWLVTRAEVIAILPQDRSKLTVGEVLDDLQTLDAPQIWKQRYWASPRDLRLLSRLLLHPRLRDHIRQARDDQPGKTWRIAEGFQPLGSNDDPEKSKVIRLPSHYFIDATSPHIDLFLLPRDCERLRGTRVTVRGRSNTATDIYSSPHVLVAQGFTSVAFADFNVSFRHALRGICGPEKDRVLLIFLAAYLRSPLAKYFLFHTSSNWGVSRQKIHVEELLRLPFFKPDSADNPSRAWEIVHEVAKLVSATATRAIDDFANREELIATADASITPLIEEYFDILPIEKVLISDTADTIIPSVRPTRGRVDVPTLKPSTTAQRQIYTARLRDTLNEWATGGPFEVQSRTIASTKLGIGIAILLKASRGTAPHETEDTDDQLLRALDHLRRIAGQQLNTFDLIRGAKIFEGERLYLVKPIARRFWTETAALNDADEIASTILMETPRGVA